MTRDLWDQIEEMRAEGCTEKEIIKQTRWDFRADLADRFLSWLSKRHWLLAWIIAHVTGWVGGLFHLWK